MAPSGGIRVDGDPVSNRDAATGVLLATVTASSPRHIGQARNVMSVYRIGTRIRLQHRITPVYVRPRQSGSNSAYGRRPDYQCHLKYFILAAALVCAFVCTPDFVQAQTITLGGQAAVASADDFATRSFQDPWDMNERTDFGWFLHGADLPAPELSNVSFSNGIFSATTGTNPNLFLLETGKPERSTLGQDRNELSDRRESLQADRDSHVHRRRAAGTRSAGTARTCGTARRAAATSSTSLRAGARTSSICRRLGIRSGSAPWNGLIRSLQFSPSYLTQFDLYIDWIRLVNINPQLCRTVSVVWTDRRSVRFVSLRLHPETRLLRRCSPCAGRDIQQPSALSRMQQRRRGEPTRFTREDWRPAPTGSLRRPSRSRHIVAVSSTTYVVNAAPTLTVTSPSEEGSTDDFATTQLGNPWDMDAISDVDGFFDVPSRADYDHPGGDAGWHRSGNTRVLFGTSVAAPGATVGDPIMRWCGRRAR